MLLPVISRSRDKRVIALRQITESDFGWMVICFELLKTKAYSLNLDELQTKLWFD